MTNVETISVSTLTVFLVNSRCDGKNIFLSSLTDTLQYLCKMLCSWFPDCLIPWSRFWVAVVV